MSLPAVPDILALIGRTPYSDPDAVPLAQVGDLWHLCHALADVCPGMQLLIAHAEGSGLQLLHGEGRLPPVVPEGSDQCFAEVPAVSWLGWAVNHLGVFPENELGPRAIAHMRQGIAKDNLRCEQAKVEIEHKVLPDPPRQDEDTLQWLAAIRAEVEALLVDQATQPSASQRTAPRL